MNVVRAGWLVAFAVVFAVMVVGLWWKASHLPQPQPPANPAPAASQPNPGTDASPRSHPIDPARQTVAVSLPDGRIVWPEAAATTATLNAADQSAREDIAAVHAVLSSYESVFGEVPEGGLNAEITRGLRGDNPKKIVFLVEKPGLLDADGALLDRWGMPYFFHKLSRRTIDLRSAGPDRKFWTKDDIFDASGNAPPL